MNCAGDSGYHSFNSSHNNNNSRLSNSPVWPAKKLVFQSHKVSSKRNDVFRQPSSDNKPVLKQEQVIRVDVSNKAKYTDNSQPNNTSDVNFIMSVNAVPFESTLTEHKVISTSEIGEQNTQPTTSAKVTTELHENSEDIVNSQQVNIPCEVNKQSSPVNELESHATDKSTNNSKPQDNTEDGTWTFCRKTLCRKTLCRKTFCQMDILPTDILPNRRFAERTFCRTDSLPNRQLAENRDVISSKCLGL